MKSRWLLLMASPALAWGAGAAAQPAGAQSLLELELEPAADPIALTVAADHADARYAVGDPVVVSVMPAEDAFLHIFDVDAAGTVTQLYPNAHAAAALARAGERRVFPMPEEPWQIIADKAGRTTIKVVATKTPSDLAARSETTPAGPFKVFHLAGDAFAGMLRASVRDAGARWGAASLALVVGDADGPKPPPLTAAELMPRTGPLDRLPTALPPPPVITPSLF